jgi:hypothetical protein
MALEKKNRVVTIDFDCKQNSSLLPILLPKSTPKVFFLLEKCVTLSLSCMEWNNIVAH